MITRRAHPRFRARVSLAVAAVAVVSGALACVPYYRAYAIDPTVLERSPYYLGSVALGRAPLGHFAVAYDRGAHPSPEMPADSVMAPLVARATAFLSELGVSRAVAGSASPADGAPEIYIGCARSPHEGSCDPTSRGVQLFARQARSTWMARTRVAARGSRVEYFLVITEELTHYPSATLRRQVAVLQFAGSIVDGAGNVLRAGAEPFDTIASTDARRPAIDATHMRRVLDDDRRADLPDAPLAWQVALENLVGMLLRRDDLVRR